MGWFRRKKQTEPETEDMAWRLAPPDPPAPAPAPPPPPEPIFDGGVVFVESDGSVNFRVSTAADAKLAIKQLKLYKKDLANQKKAVQLDINVINAERRDQLARQGRMVKGGGDVGKTIRAFQSASRSADRRRHEARLDPHQARKAEIERRVHLIDQAILVAEGYVLKQGPAD